MQSENCEIIERKIFQMFPQFLLKKFMCVNDLLNEIRFTNIIYFNTNKL